MILECKSISDKLTLELQSYIKTHKINKRLSIIYQGNEDGQQSYIKNIIKHCSQFNIDYDLWNIKQKDLNKKDIFAINQLYDSIICVKPFLHSNQDFLKQYINKNKDIDDFSDNSIFTSCTAEGVIEILKHYNITTCDKLVLIIGRNEGDKICNLLSNKINNATTVKTHSKTPKNMFNTLLDLSDVIITATGKNNILNQNNISKDKNKIIIDIGRGDVAEELYQYNNLKITPKINGTGLITTLELMKHIVKGV